MATELKIRVIFEKGTGSGSSEEVVKDVKAVEGSLKNLEAEYKRLQNIANTKFAVGTPEQIQAANNATMAYKKYADALALTGANAAKVRPQMDGMTHGSANAAMTLQAMNYTIRDSPYFFRDFSLGILAIGNNLNPLIDGLIRMRQETGSLFKGLIASLSGTQGLIFFFSVLVSVIQAVTFAMAKNKQETKETEKAYSDYIQRIRDMISDFRQLNEAQDVYRKNLQSTKIDELESIKDFAELQKSKGGTVVKGEFIPYTNEQMKEFDLTIAQTTNKIATLKQQFSEGSPDIQKFDRYIVGMTEAIKGGSEGILNFAKANSLSRSQLEGILSRFKELNEQIYSYNGSLRKDLPEGVRGMVTALGLQKKALEETIPVLDAFLNPDKSKKGKTSTDINEIISELGLKSLDKYIEKQKKILKNYEDEKKKIEEAAGTKDQKSKALALAQQDRDIELKKLELEKESGLNKEKEKFAKSITDLRKRLSDEAVKWEIKGIEERGDREAAELKRIYVEYMQSLKEARNTGNISESQYNKYGQAATSGFARSLEDIFSKKNEDNIKKATQLTDKEKQTISDLRNVANVTGNAIYDSFLHAKEGVGQFLETLLLAYAKLLAIKLVATAIETVVGLPAGTIGGFGAKAQNGYIVPGTSYTGDRVPILANSGEMILNEAQQRNLLKLLSAPVNVYQQYSVAQRDAMNMNIGNQEPNTILIQTDIEGLRFTKKKINPAQARLLRGNIKNVT